MNRILLLLAALASTIAVSGCETIGELKLAMSPGHDYSQIRNNESTAAAYIGENCEIHEKNLVKKADGNGDANLFAAPVAALVLAPVAVAAVGAVTDMATTAAQHEIKAAIDKYSASYKGIITISNASMPGCLIMQRMVKDTDGIEKVAMDLKVDIEPSTDKSAFKLKPYSLVLHRSAAKTNGPGEIALKAEIKLEATNIPPATPGSTKPAATKAVTETLADETMEVKISLPEPETDNFETLGNFGYRVATKDKILSGAKLLRMSESGWFPAPIGQSNLTVRFAIGESGLGTKGLEMLGKLLDDTKDSIKTVIKDTVQKAMAAQ